MWQIGTGPDATAAARGYRHIQDSSHTMHKNIMLQAPYSDTYTHVQTM